MVVEITTARDYHRFEKRVREAGFEHDPESGVICCFKEPRSGLLLDVMPTEASILGFENRWQAEAFPHAVESLLPSGRAKPLREYVAHQIEELSRHPLFDNGIEGALAGPEAYERLELVVRPRIAGIIASRP